MGTNISKKADIDIRQFEVSHENYGFQLDYIDRFIVGDDNLALDKLSQHTPPSAVGEDPSRDGAVQVFEGSLQELADSLRTNISDSRQSLQELKDAFQVDKPKSELKDALAKVKTAHEALKEQLRALGSGEELEDVCVTVRRNPVSKNSLPTEPWRQFSIPYMANGEQKTLRLAVNENTFPFNNMINESGRLAQTTERMMTSMEDKLSNHLPQERGR